MRRAAAIVLAVILAGCGDLPQPFRHTAPNPLLAPLPLAGVTVSPFIDAPDPQALAEAMAEALVAHEIVAVVGAPRSEGLTVEAFVSEDGDSVLVSWQLRGRDAVTLQQHVQRVPVAVWRSADGRAATARAAAPALAAALVPPPAPVIARPTVVVPQVGGAPGDGATALAAAMAGALRRHGFTLGTGEYAFVVEGMVTVTRESDGHDHVAITWTVRDADGKELATVQQANPVPRGSLDGAWGSLARIVAEAAAEGVAEVLANGSVSIGR